MKRNHVADPRKTPETRNVAVTVSPTALPAPIPAKTTDFFNGMNKERADSKKDEKNTPDETDGIFVLDDEVGNERNAKRRNKCIHGVRRCCAET